ncbi:hypothetical protein Ptr902_06472 [Pyrenophora tritici-repentis]|uniref:Uncharacterized protein n=1 Tax=Pyrenophora tritici-repentis TaxID=45151 RepID=A0A5M9LLF2_9PLEO|nr:hypothetical protein PtrV1_00422 [Pyrenophora tritici-repentis]KAF7576196.1 hypothetical protein PtrM4_004360 [Pyrenophora tritici-repentis]KAI0573681.1 hypothetical protein Alg215_09057 [Pyrenophora tritici-repentis]KAI0591439.1 hypothetical protein Alg130_01263 [Pyrenophora tritici-repentis]KAI0611553.1 hypothetical protein TUN205_04165 [Pyrenophora tritici-repentis]
MPQFDQEMQEATENTHKAQQVKGPCPSLPASPYM